MCFAMSRLNDMVLEIGGIGRNEDGSITRLGFSEGYFQALEKVKERMESLGMQTEVDPVGNLHGVLPGKDPSLKSIVLGSHLDTVIKGGVFDGMLGVTGAVECVYRLKEQGITLDHTLEIWGFNMEESSILGGTFGSRCVVGMVDPDAPGYAQRLAQFGCDPQKVRSARRDGRPVRPSARFTRRRTSAGRGAGRVSGSSSSWRQSLCRRVFIPFPPQSAIGAAFSGFWTACCARWCG